MKDATHHMRHLQRKVIQSSKRARAIEEAAQEKNGVMAVNPSEESGYLKKKK